MASTINGFQLKMNFRNGFVKVVFETNYVLKNAQKMSTSKILVLKTHYDLSSKIGTKPR